MNEFETSSQVRVEARYKAMGGEFYFMAYPQVKFSKAEVTKLFDEAFAEVARIESKFTDFKPSPFNAINDVETTKLDDETWNLFMQACDFSKATDGLFDITFATLSHRLRSKGEELTPEKYAYYKGLIDYKMLHFDREKRTITRKNPDIRVGFGGIGKGYAVDCAYKILKAAGLVNFYVNGSGDIRVHSAPDAPRPWKLGIRNPFSSNSAQACGVVQLANGALVTSGSYVQGAHIVNPKSDKSSELVSVTLIGEDALTVDVLATASMNMQVSHALEFINSQKLMGILIDKSGKSYLSSSALKNFASF